MKINLSGSEWKLMNRLGWERSPRTITQLTAALKEETGWTKNTVITMLFPLEPRGGGHREGARAKEYYPLRTARTPSGRRRRAFWARSTGPAGPHGQRHGGQPPADGGDIA